MFGKFIVMIGILIVSSINLNAQFNSVYKGEQTKRSNTGNVFLDSEEENRVRKKEEGKKIQKDLNLKNEVQKDSIKEGKKDLNLKNEVQKDSIKEGKKVTYRKLPLIEEEEEIRQLVFMPLEKIHVTSNFGKRFHPIHKETKNHNGVDLRANYDNVQAILKGKVIEEGFSKSNGYYVVLEHNDYSSYYLHLSNILVKKGDVVNSGDIIGISGNTGYSTAPHLHFAVKENGNWIDPIGFLNDLILTNNTLITYGTN